MIHKFRTSFPANANFDKWWIKSKKGLVAQLIKDKRDLHERFLYKLKYESNNQTGHGQFTTEQLVEQGVTIRRERATLDE